MAKIRDDKQEYQYSYPFVTPSGHEFTFYDTPSNERLVVKHSSGSHIEFMADGSIQIRAVTDIHQIQGVMSSSGSGSEQNANVSVQRVDTDHTIEVGGKLNIRCSELNFEVGSKGAIFCGTDLELKANNILERANEAVDIESSKSIHLDTKEMKTSSVTNRTSQGTEEATSPWGGGGAGTALAEGKSAGYNVQHVKGHHVIKNDDPTGGITIVSAGYLNLICGQERLDLVGKYLTTGYTAEQRATWTQSVYLPTPPGPQNISKPGGDYWFQSDSSGMYKYAQKMVSPLAGGAGFKEDVMLGNHMSNTIVGNKLQVVAAGNKDVTVGQNITVKSGAQEMHTNGGQFIVKAKMIYLN